LDGDCHTAASGFGLFDKLSEELECSPPISFAISIAVQYRNVLGQFFLAGFDVMAYLNAIFDTIARLPAA